MADIPSYAKKIAPPYAKPVSNNSNREEVIKEAMKPILPENWRDTVRNKVADLSSRLPESLRFPAAALGSLAVDLGPEAATGILGRGVKVADPLIKNVTKGNVTIKPKVVKGIRTPPYAKPIKEVIEEPLKPLKGRAEAPRIRKNDPAVGKSILDEVASLPRSMPQVLTQSVDDATPTITQAAKPSLKEAWKEENFFDLANLPKSINSSFDISFPFRQGILFAGKKSWRKSWAPMKKALMSEEGFAEGQRILRARPKFEEAVNNGLALTDFDESLMTGLGKDAIKRLSRREEAFASRLAESLPYGIGKAIRASSRAYTAFGNHLRYGQYENMTDAAEHLLKKGKLDKPIELVKKNITNYINTSTGRGSLGLRIGETSERMENAAELLNTVFWSPRLLTSRLQTLNPLSYTKLDPFTRKEALKDLFRAVSAGMGILTLGKLAGAEVELNPTSTDFAKAKFGNTRVDLTGGFSPMIRFIAQSIEGLSETVLKEGFTKDYTGGPDAFRFARSKLSPAASVFVDQQQGETYLGRSVKTPGERGIRIAEVFTPMIVQDMIELSVEDPGLLGLAPVAAVGGSIQVYGEKKGSGSSRKMPRISLPSSR